MRSSSSSSSISGLEGWAHLPGRFTCYSDPSVTCLAAYKSIVYAGFGSQGKVLRSTDHFSWAPYLTIPDERVRAIHGWSNGLFIGAEPTGNIWVKNLTNDSFTLSLQTDDQAVTAFGEFAGDLYAGTSPGGRVYRFDGVRWSKELDAYGGGITSIVSDGSRLYFGIKNAETMLAFDGKTWSVLPLTSRTVTAHGMPLTDPSLASGAQLPTLSSLRKSDTEPLSEGELFIQRATLGSAQNAVDKGLLTAIDQASVKSPNPVRSVLCASDAYGQLLIGTDQGHLLSYSDGVLTTLYQIDKSIGSLAPLDANTILFASGNQLNLVGIPILVAPNDGGLPITVTEP